MNILLIDDHPLFRSGIVPVVRELAESVRCAEADSCEEALELMGPGTDFALILLDLALPGMDGMEGMAKLRDAAPATPIVVLSATETPAKIKQAIEAGAKGYIPKSAGREIILNALRLVLSGGVYLPTTIMHGDVATKPRDAVEGDGLTPRQGEVLRLLAEGKSNKEIADALELAENTVRTHVAAILKRLGVKNRTEAGFAAVTLGLLDEGS